MRPPNGRPEYVLVLSRGVNEPKNIQERLLRLIVVN